MTPPVTSTTPIQKAPTWPKVTPPNALVRAAGGLDNSMRFLTRAGGRSRVPERNRQVRTADSPGFDEATYSCRTARDRSTRVLNESTLLVRRSVTLVEASRRRRGGSDSESLKSDTSDSDSGGYSGRSVAGVRVTGARVATLTPVTLTPVTLTPFGAPGI